MLVRSVEFGEFFKNLRMARGLRLKDVARDTLSVSQLSKFENGHSMLTADKMLLAIESIHMTFAEFGHAMMQCEERGFRDLSDKLIEAQALEDLTGLKRMLNYYSNKESLENYDRLNILVIKANIHILDSSFEILEEDKEFLATYLYAIEEWTEFELFVFGNTLFVLPYEDVIFLAKALVRSDKFYGNISDNRKRFELVLINLTLMLLMCCDFHRASYFLEILEEVVTFHDMFACIILNFLKKLIDFLEGKKLSLSDLETYIDIVEGLGNDILVKTLRVSLKKLVGKNS